MKFINSMLNGTKNTVKRIAPAVALFGSLYFGACDNPVQPPIDPPIDPPKPKPSITHTASLDANGIDINYSASLKNLKEAKLSVYRDGNPIIFRPINDTDTSYSERFSYSTNKEITDANYVFALNGKTLDGKDTSITANVTIPNYEPTFSLAGLNAGFDEDSSIILNLEDKIKNSDKNPNHNPVSIAGVVPIDGKTETSFSGYNVTIKNKPGQIGNYQVRVDVGSDVGGKANATLSGNIDYYPTVSGTLENNSTKHPVNSGAIIAYEVVGNDTLKLPTNNSDSQGNNFTNTIGNFNFKIQKGASKLTEIVLKATEGAPGNYQSWTRTIGLPPQNHENVLIRTVPYGQHMNNPKIFEQFMLELSKKEIPRKFDIENLQGIQILPENPFGAQYGTFTSEKQNQIKDKILDKNDINGIIGQYKIKPEQVFVGNNPKEFSLYPTDSIYGIIPNSGWVIISPNSRMPSAGLTDTRDPDAKIVSQAVIYMRPDALFNMGLASHESEHAFCGPGHTTTASPSQSIMNVSTGLSTISTTGPFDKEAGKIIYESTFMYYPQFGTPHVDYLKNILGKNPD